VVRRQQSGWGIRRAIPVVVALGALATGSSAAAQTGGAGPPGSTTTTTTTTGVPGAATLASDGTAIPPSDAPRAVRKAINAGNRIHTLPYVWGGGHNRKFRGTGYDCSGAVSYVLHAAGMLRSPLASTGLARWGQPGAGQWITIYANRSHAYAVIAGLRWDTSAVGEALNQGSGPRWRGTQRDPAGYTARFFPGY
jgi:hypothetical protein